MTRILILLENLPLDRDARVRKEAIALRDAGYDVTVICRRGANRSPVPGVRVADYPAPPEGSSATAFLVEYAWSMVAAAGLVAREMRRGRVAVIQACNPPDLYWMIAAPLKRLGVRFVFDHHDASPEVYLGRGGKAGGLMHRGLLAVERATFWAADHVLSTNDSLRELAITRGRVDPDRVTVVRNGPELSRLSPPRRDDALRRGHRHMAVWVGVIGMDDGVEEALHAWRLVVGADGAGADALLVLIGEGERRAACEALAKSLGIAENVHFAGWQETADVYRYLAAADIALALDPPGPRADRSTMMKVMEYMVMGLPVVAHHVHETKVSAGPAGVYVHTDPQAVADAITALFADPERRERMGELGQARIVGGLSWDEQSQTYVRIFDELTGRDPSTRLGSPRETPVSASGMRPL